MKLLFILLVLGLVVTGPFLWLKKPWAVKLARRLRLILIIYVIIIAISAVLRIVFNWDEFYG